MATTPNSSDAKNTSADLKHTVTAKTQEFKVKGGQLLDKVKEILEDGNARRIVIRNGDRTLVEFPLAVGVGGAAAAVLIAPTLAAVGAIAALLTDLSVVVEHDADGDGTPESSMTLMGPDSKKAAAKTSAKADAGDSSGKTMGGEAK